MKKLLNRFVDIWRLDFLAKFFAGEKNDNKTTISFWIIINVFIAIVLSISFCIFLHNAANELSNYIDVNVAQEARITIENGQLTTQNIDKPFFREIKAQNTVGDYNGNYVVIIDTESNTYDLTALDEYNGGIIVASDRVYFKDGPRINNIMFSDISDLSVSKNDVMGFIKKYTSFPFTIFFAGLIGIFLFVWFAGFRLVTALWWALMLFVLMKIFDVKDDYITAYKSVLNLYFIPTIAVFIVSIFGLNVPLLTTIIFLAVFIANLLWIKKHPQTESMDTVLNDVAEIEVAPIKQTEKNNDNIINI